MALYHPQFGYYSAPRPRLGEGGDFYTSAYLTSLFGELLAHQFEEMWQALGRGPFTIVEYGAGSGLLCRDILDRLRENAALYEKLNYFIIEKSGAMRDRERRLLPGKVEWRESIREIGAVTGCVFSNELVDNFPVHRVQLPSGYQAEINLDATRWIQEVGEALAKGWVMTIDYGYSAAVLYSKRSGTLACYHRHRVHDCPYEYIGEQDITSHVNFSALDHWGRSKGLEVGGYSNQILFLQGLGLAGRVRNREEKGMEETDRRRLRTFLMEMGQKFKVLIQHKGVGPVPLSGLVFSGLLG